MGWERGKYYTRSGKVNGRVVREYVGCGEIGRMAAEADAIRREMRSVQREAEKQLMAELREIDETIAKLSRRADLAARAAMSCAGYHQHDRGQWRKKRVRKPTG